MGTVKKGSYFELRNWKRTVEAVLTGDIEHPHGDELVLSENWVDCSYY